MDTRIQDAFRWLDGQRTGSVTSITSVKELSRLVTACALWEVPDHYASRLMRMKRDHSWNESVRDTARAGSALADIGILFPDSVKWLLDHQHEHDASWNNDVYDTAYALSALADMGTPNEKGCRWLVENYGADWEHPGTTSLIITALIKQERIAGTGTYRGFIRERAHWLLSRRMQDGGWEFISTSNIVMQALMHAGFKGELEVPVQWLLGKLNDKGWWGKKEGDVTATALSLITLGRYRV